jgi:hypothetical protein
MLQTLFGDGAPGQRLWDADLVNRWLCGSDRGARSRRQLAAIASPAALEDDIGRARSQDEVKCHGQRCLDAVSLALPLALVAQRGW